MLSKYSILVALVLVGILSFTSSYTAPTYNSINFSLCSGYTAPMYNDINFTLGDDESCITDSCTYSSGDWVIDCNDNCSIDTDVVLDDGDLIFDGVGKVFLNADVTNYSNLDMGTATDICNIILKSGVSLEL